MEGIPDIAPFRARKDELEGRMSAPDFFSDPRKAAEISREAQKLGDLIELAEAYHRTEQQLADNKELAYDRTADEELREMAEAEMEPLQQQLADLQHKVLMAMIPPDPIDSRNTIIEIRAGAGGDEASLFAGDLYRMYTRYAERNGWRIEPMSSSPSDVGGYKEVCFLVTGEEVYRKLKYESGVHRVQRIPTTESGGRIHTSTVTVAMMPEAEEVDVEINPNELEITTMRASGAGGQHVNTTDSAVRIVHLPTGEMVYCADERSQNKNRDKAMKVLYSRLLEKKQRAEQEKYAAERKQQVGTGDRSERIRTYNFPQSRMTDHRIGLTLQSLDAVMDGDLEEVSNALEAADSHARLAALLEKQSA
ncbi:MAG: peptide chain release factor 1 [Opitutales bacterium]